MEDNPEHKTSENINIYRSSLHNNPELQKIPEISVPASSSPQVTGSKLKLFLLSKAGIATIISSVIVIAVVVVVVAVVVTKKNEDKDDPINILDSSGNNESKDDESTDESKDGSIEK